MLAMGNFTVALTHTHAKAVIVNEMYDIFEQYRQVKPNSP